MLRSNLFFPNVFRKLRRKIEKNKYNIKISNLYISIDKLKKLVLTYQDKSIKFINKAGLNAKKDQPLDEGKDCVKSASFKTVII